jgi:carbamate kinase
MTDRSPNTRRRVVIMGAACRFVEATGRLAAIGALTEVEALLRGTAGTQIVPTMSWRFP